MSNELTMVITYNLTKDEFAYSGTVKPELVKDMVSEFLRSQMGKGADDRPPNEIDEYVIQLGLDLSFDRVSCTDNCGNKGLREGILMRFLSKWEEDKE